MKQKCRSKDKIVTISKQKEKRFNPRTGRGPNFIYVYLVHNVDSDSHEKKKEKEEEEEEEEQQQQQQKAESFILFQT